MKKETPNEHVKRITKPIFDKIPQETPLNRMSVGRCPVSKKDISFYQPHNFRLYFDFSKENFNPPKNQTTGLKRSVVSTYEYKIKNSTEHFFKGYHNCNLTVKKNQIEVVNLIDHKRWYVIDHKGVDNYDRQEFKIKNNKINECISVLKKFIKEFGGDSKFVLLKDKSEDKVMAEDRIDDITKKSFWNGSTNKKLYEEDNVEFKGSTFAFNYFHNRAIEKIAPKIESAIRSLDPLRFLKSVLNSHLDVLNYVNEVNLLDHKELIEMELWLFQRFGECNRGV